MGKTARESTAGNALRLKDIVDRLGGTLRGQANPLIRRVASLKSAGDGDISFLSDLRYRSRLEGSQASALILPEKQAVESTQPAILCRNPYLYFAEVAVLLAPNTAVAPGRHPSATIEGDAKVSPMSCIEAGAYIGHRAKIAAGVTVGPGCVVGADVILGKETRLHANVVIYENCRIGQRGIIHSGAIIGADGFGMVLKDGRWLKIPQTGRVIIGDDVEIGANTTIDRGALDDTIIEDGVKLDNLIQVGHNVRIGAHTAIAGCAGIAGSAVIGRHCTIGGGAVILGHLEIADDVHVSAATLITKSIATPGTYTGAFPFDEHKQWGRTAVAIRHLAEMSRGFRQLKKTAETATGKKTVKTSNRAVASVTLPAKTAKAKSKKER